MKFSSLNIFDSTSHKTTLSHSNDFNLNCRKIIFTLIHSLLSSILQVMWRVAEICMYIVALRLFEFTRRHACEIKKHGRSYTTLKKHSTSCGNETCRMEKLEKKKLSEV